MYYSFFMAVVLTVVMYITIMIYGDDNLPYI